MHNIRLIATDLDGTLIKGAREFRLYSVFRDRINDLRKENSAWWAVCTGRDWRSFHRFFTPMRAMEIVPDFIILKHAYIYTHSAVGFIPHVMWNLRTRCLLWADRLNVSRAITGWHRAVGGIVPDMKTIQKNRSRLWLRFDTEEGARLAWELLREQTATYKHLRVFKYLREVDVRGVPFTKGLAVHELARHLDLSPANVLGIGNGHNDISMFDSEVAVHTGCPSNSEADVIKSVHDAGGHIAGEPSLSGVLDILDAYRNGSVRSDLPGNWQDPAEGPNPSKEHSRHRSHRRRLKFSTKCLIALGAYTVITAFASFNLIPFVSEWIMKPFYLLVSLFRKALMLF
ncbi:MAG: HAD hydrolase family protein [Kiritimatiellia bacterium]